MENPNGLIELDGAAAQENYLGNIGVVEALLRGFLREAIDKRVAVNQQGDTDDLRGFIDSRANALADIFLGQSAAYTPQRAWNDPQGGIVDNVRKRFGFSADSKPRDVIKGGLAYILTALAVAEKADELGGDWKSAIDEGIEIVLATFLGIDMQQLGYGE